MFKFMESALGGKTKLILILLITEYSLLIAQWQPDNRLTNNSAPSEYPTITASGLVLHVTWRDERDGNAEIYYKRSSDGGSNWVSDTRLTNNSSVSHNPSISALGLNVHVVWRDERDGNEEIYYKRSTDGGLNWGSDTRMTNNNEGSEDPVIISSGLNVYLVWQDSRDGNMEIYFKRSTDGGSNWGIDTRLTNNPFFSVNASIAVSGSTIHIVWEDDRNTPGVNFEIYYKRSGNEGITWGADVRMTNNIGYSWFSSVSASGLYAQIVWTEDENSYGEIYHKRSTDDGSNWTANTRISSNDSMNSEYPYVITSGTYVHLVWYDVRDGNNEIYYKRSGDYGMNWVTDTRLTINDADSRFPNITISGSEVHLVWQDDRNLNDEIYYKKNPTGNPVGIENIDVKIPNEFSLSQNYPNPFNPTTNIEFNIPKTSFVKLTVYDVLGKEIAVLVNEDLIAGTYKYDWDASEWTSGIYYYQLISGEFTGTKKMALIK